MGVVLAILFVTCQSINQSTMGSETNHGVRTNERTSILLDAKISHNAQGALPTQGDEPDNTPNH